MYVDVNYFKYRDYKNTVSWEAKICLSKLSEHYDREGPMQFEGKAYLHGRRRIDIDNILKALFDGCNKIVWRDDSQVTKATIEKIGIRKAEVERVEIVITLI